MKNTQKAVQERRQDILRAVLEKGEVTVEEIALTHKISGMTVRRDFKAMENNRLLYRIHGGAISFDRFSELNGFHSRVEENREKISRYAERYVEDGDILFINGSRTALNMLRYVGAKKVLVYTNNGWAMEEKYPSGVKICLTGGEIRGRVMVGDYVMRNLLYLTVDKIFIGCAAVYSDGEFRYDIPTEIGINEAMISRTKNKVYVLVDHTKFQKRETTDIRYGSAVYEKQIVLITDEKADRSIVESLKNRGIEVVVACE